MPRRREVESVIRVPGRPGRGSVGREIRGRRRSGDAGSGESAGRVTRVGSGGIGRHRQGRSVGHPVSLLRGRRGSLGRENTRLPDVRKRRSDFIHGSRRGPHPLRLEITRATDMVQKTKTQLFNGRPAPPRSVGREGRVGTDGSAASRAGRSVGCPDAKFASPRCARRVGRSGVTSRKRSPTATVTRSVETRITLSTSRRLGARGRVAEYRRALPRVP